MASNRWVTNPVEQMKACVPEAFFRDTLIALRDANRVAAAACRDLEPEWRKGAFAHLRREYFNQGWKVVARRHGGRARAVLNANNATSHLEVTLGGITFTPVALQGPGEFPPDCEYRNTLAASNQLTLFRRMGLEEEEPAPNAQLYAVFAYSSDVEEESGLPVFAFIGFPHHRKKKYVEPPYQLLRLINELGKPTDSPSAPLVSPPPPSPDVGGPAPGFQEEHIDEDLPLRFIGRSPKQKPRENE